MQSLQCIVQLASVRRSLFQNEAERKVFLAEIMKQTIDVMDSSGGFHSTQNRLSPSSCFPLCEGDITSWKMCIHTNTGIEDEGVFHELSRLLARIKANFQLTEIVGVDEYERWVEYAARITVESLTSWQFGLNADHYLLSFWRYFPRHLVWVFARGFFWGSFWFFMPHVDGVPVEFPKK